MSDKKVTGVLGKDGKVTISAQLTSDFTPVTRANGDTQPLQKGRINIVDAESGEAIEEIDVYTSADAVYYDAEHTETILDYIDFRLQYSNTTKVPYTVGGIQEGTSFVEMDLKDIVTKLLYPEIGPIISLTSSQDTSELRERGTAITPTTFTLDIHKTLSAPRTAILLKNDLQVSQWENVMDTEDQTLELSYVAQITDDSEFKARVSDYNNRTTESEIIQYHFVDPIFYGTTDLALASINDTTLSNSSKSLISDTKPEELIELMVSSENKKVMLGIKPNWTINRIYDNNMMDVTSAFESMILTHTRPDTTECTYTIYLSKDNLTIDNFNFYLDII